MRSSRRFLELVKEYGGDLHGTNCGPTLLIFGEVTAMDDKMGTKWWESEVKPDPPLTEAQKRLVDELMQSGGWLGFFLVTWPFWVALLFKFIWWGQDTFSWW